MQYVLYIQCKNEKNSMNVLHRKLLILGLLVLCVLIFNLSASRAKFVIEPCSSTDSCTSLLSYFVPFESKLSEISSRFNLNISDLLAANWINQTIPFIGNQILGRNSVIRIPISCPCTGGIRRSVSTIYTFEAADTFESISSSYGGLVSADQIRTVNGFSMGQNNLLTGARVVIPLPCTCFNNNDDGIRAVYMTYVVQSDEDLESIATKYQVTVSELVRINELGQANVDPGDILAIPIPACSSENLNWYNESLIVPVGSYALTANHCIKCACGSADLKLQCFPSSSAASCSHLQCKNSSLFIGDVYEEKTKLGCKVSTCVYRGHSGGKIFRSLKGYSQAQCSHNKTFLSRMPRSSSSSFTNPIIPNLSSSPQPGYDPTNDDQSGAPSPGTENQAAPKISSDSPGLIVLATGRSSYHSLYLFTLFLLLENFIF